MSQSRRQSGLEAVANVVIGFGTALLAQLMLFPVVGLSATYAQNIWLAVCFTVVSLVRSYALRRLFNAFDRRPV